MTSETSLRPLALAAALPLAFACGRADPPAPSAPANIAPLPGASAAPTASAAVTAPASAPAIPAAASAAPPTGDLARDLTPKDATEPQTEDRPSVTDPLFLRRAQALYEAIRDDAPDTAMPFFFPVDAYKQVKDVTFPERDWKNRLVAEFVRDIHELHRVHRRSLEGSTFAGIDVPEARGKWVNPKEEYNKIGYFRVFGSLLKWEKEGRTFKAEVKSLISWRGQYFCVHLSAIQRKKEE